ncbi:hypothetical protein H6G06_22830 [Anabaena sphaerica FACHB-251]|uniref:Conserved hypothetical protein CHP02391 domain-containing protein n=1 Tax=Anabaena sphaerica FACHB-251 TaxID=2692883 RepID=A0A926WLC1_9NOST|nr:TIGR02391 family protein [Anabaena sphaerica]MBD2296237.1 hypothetical protein [Anabaena sphaerica FACHB-251]
MKYNLTDSQKNLLKELVALIQSGSVDEEFRIFWSGNDATGYSATLVSSNKPGKILTNATKSGINALERSGLLSCQGSSSRPICALTEQAYTVVETNFNAPDTSFMEYLTPMSGTNEFDEELKMRCLPLLATGGSDPMLWDSVVRTAGVILEERLRDVGSISDPNLTGQGLVNKVFNNNGTLASKFIVDSERQGYRDLYAGIVGSFRNPSAHKLIDPTPEEGGAFIIFLNLLLKKLEALR